MLIEQFWGIPTGRDAPIIADIRTIPCAPPRYARYVIGHREDAGQGPLYDRASP